LAAPRAKKAAERSSMCDQQRIRGSRTSESTIGVDRDPGEVHACCIPHRASSSQKARNRRYVSTAVMIWGCDDVDRGPSPWIHSHREKLGFGALDAR
jgi:hypothetical protein